MIYAVVEDASSNMVAVAQGGTFTTLDGFPPVISGVTLPSITTSNASVNVTSSETGLLHWAVLVSGATAPSVLSLKAGTAPRAKSFANDVAVLAGNETSFTITGLAEGTSYTIYVAAEDDSGNFVGSAFETAFTTFAVASVVAPDLTKPQLSGVSVSAITETGAAVFAISNKAGKLHYCPSDVTQD